MATYSLRPLPQYWDGADYSVGGEGRAASVGGDGTTPFSAALACTSTQGTLALTHLLLASPFTLVQLEEANGLPEDTTPPEVGGFSPSDGATIAEDEALTVTVTGAALVLVYASMEGNSPELAYDGEGPTAGYSVTATTDEDELSLEVVRDAGWFGTVVFGVIAVDDAGNTVEDTVGYEAPPAVPADASAPEVSVSPAPGNLLPNQSITVEVTDDSGSLALVLLVAQFAFSQAPEVVHDGSGFTAPYAGHSMREAITSGWRYTLLRNSGWPGTFTLTPYALDAAGNQAA
jgi:hypothetical protein